MFNNIKIVNIIYKNAYQTSRGSGFKQLFQYKEILSFITIYYINEIKHSYNIYVTSL